MSYIDIFPHRRVGTLAGYPLYHPTSDITGHGRGHPQFSATPKNLILGGGSGEHPGLVVHEFDVIVRLYLLHAIDLSTSAGTPRTSAIEDLEDDLVAGLELRFDLMFDFCGWEIEEIVALAGAVKSPALATPYDEASHSSIEHWLAYSLGELCVMELPELMSPVLTQTLETHVEAVRDIRSYWLANVNYET